MATAMTILYSLGPALEPPIPFPVVPPYEIEAVEHRQQDAGRDQDGLQVVDEQVDGDSDASVADAYRTCLYGGGRQDSVRLFLARSRSRE
jgi:hypothetical protein